MLKKLILVSLFISTQAFAGLDLQKWFNILTRGAVSASGNVKGQDGITHTVSNDIGGSVSNSRFVNEFFSKYDDFKESIITSANDIKEIATDVGNMAVEAMPKPIVNLARKIDENRGTTALVAVSALIAYNITKNIFKAKKSDRFDGKSRNDGKTKVGGSWYYETSHPIRDLAAATMLLGSGYSLYKANSVMNWFTKKVS